MSKRTREDDKPDQGVKKRKGFSVGPANLPDGTYRRKTQKIKDDLISKAKVRKAYAKIKSRDVEDENVPKYDPYEGVDDPTRVSPEADPVHGAEVQQEMHPDRLARLNEPQEVEEPDFRIRKRQKQRKRTGANAEGPETMDPRPVRQARSIEQPLRYQKEFAEAEEQKAQQIDRQKARELRDRERRAMTKARKPGKDGKPRLGRQSNVLLSRVQRLVAEA